MTGSRSALAERLAGLSPKKRALLLRQLSRKDKARPAERIERQPRPAERFPVSFSQLRGWILERLEPGTSAHNVPQAFVLEGAFDLPVLHGAARAVVARHESLRTTFAAEAGEPVQVIAPRLDLELPLVDLRGMPETGREREANRLTQEEGHRPFDLETGPLLRIVLLRLAPERHYLLLTIHHVVSDGWSMGIFSQEMVALYQAGARGEVSPLGELPIQYPDFAVWQRRRLEGESLEKLVGYWRGQLEGADMAPELSVDRPRPAVMTHEGDEYMFFLGTSLGSRLRALAKAENASPFMVQLAVFATLLRRLSGSADFLLGTYIANRNRTETAGLIGFFINTLVLRARFHGLVRFRELLGRLRATTLEGYNHQDLPFEKLLDVLAVERDPSRTPLFQALCVFQNFPVSEARVDKLSLTPVRVESHRTEFDLALWGEDRGEALGLRLQYSTNLFDKTTMLRMVLRMKAMFEAVAEDPDTELATLGLPAGAERHQLTVESSEGRRGVEAYMGVHRRFEVTSREQPDAVAVATLGQRLSYRELDRRANGLAHQLVGEGTVAVEMPSSPEFLVAVLAAFKAGAAYLPVDPDWPEQRRAFLLEDARVGTVLTRERCTLTLRDQPPEVSDEPGRSAYVIYTSGSTGKPKGVEVSHGALAAFVSAAAGMYGVTPRDRVLQFAAVTFDTCCEEIYPCLTTGATLVLHDASLSSAAELWGEAEQQGITFVDLPTAYWHTLVATGGVPPASVRLVILGGEAVNPGALARWSEYVGSSPRLVNTYGPTEATVVVALAELAGETCASGRVPIGRPIAGAEVGLFDSRLQPVSLGVVGELVLAGSGLARGYLGRAATTAARFVPHPTGVSRRLYRSGDLGRRLVDGRLEFVGRVDGQVKVRGYRIELGEVEAALNAHETVREAVVVAVPGRVETAAVRLAAYVAHGSEAPAADALRAHLRTILPDYMLPAFFVPLAEIPKTSHGKVDRRALPAPESEASAKSSYVAPRSELEHKLSALWADVLGLDRVGTGDNFFEIGGDSLMLLRMHERLASDLEVEIEVISLFRYPTVGALAEHLRRRREGTGGRSITEVRTATEQRKDKASERRDRLRQMRRTRRPRRGSRR